MDSQPLKLVARTISGRYGKPFDRHFAYWKVQMDPLYQGVGGLLAGSSLPVLDVGCGTGLLCFYLLEQGVLGPLHGLDFDPQKIAAARKAAEALPNPPVFHQGDARDPWPDISGHVCLLDVLHYLPPDAQASLLTSAARHVAPGGRLVIRTGLKAENWRYRVTLMTDRLMNRLKLMKSPPVSYPEQGALETVLNGAGLQLITARPLHEGTPFNNHLLIFGRGTSLESNLA